MAKVIGPLFSMQASGTLAGTITYVCGHFARKAKVILDDSQVMPEGQTLKFMYAVKTWNYLSGQIKQDWKDFGKIVKESKQCIEYELKLTGYQLFLSYYLTFGEDGWKSYPEPGPPP